MSNKVMSLRLDEKKITALKQITEATKIPMAELVKQGVDRVIETYQVYIPDAQFKKELNLIFDDSAEYLRRLAKDE